MLYLLDANVLITASRTYYEISRVPEFWAWLVHMGEQNNVKIVQEVYEEITVGNDELASWVKQPGVEAALRFSETVDINQVRVVTAKGYASDLTDDEIEKIGRDPFLLAYAIVDPANRCIVTTEISKPKRTRGNRKIPNVCSDFGIKCFNTFELTAALDFSTSWQ